MPQREAGICIPVFSLRSDLQLEEALTSGPHAEEGDKLMEAALDLYSEIGYGND